MITLRPLVVSCVACICATAMVHVQSRSAAPAFARTELTPPPSTGWPTNGGNLKNQRYSPLTELTPLNVGRLKVRWAYQIGVTGVPTYVINNRYAIVGAQPYEAFKEALEQIAKQSPDK